MLLNIGRNILMTFTFFLCGGVSSLDVNHVTGGYSEENCLNKNSNCKDLKYFDGAFLNSYDSTEPTVLCTTRTSLKVESMTCFSSTGSLDCGQPLPVGTLVSFTCPPFYEATKKISMCKSDGNWTVPIKCNPECGRTPSAAVPLIMYGRSAEPGQFPWAAALYLRFNGQWSFNCGGTLIADNAVITAAHCTWNMKKENMLIVLGNIPRTLPENYNNLQVFRIKRVFILPVFRDATNYYNSDIAILSLETHAQLSEKILPACLPDPNRNNSVTPFTSGIVAGWGMNEKRKPPLSLQYMRVPIIDMVRCMKYIPKQFTKFVAFTSFCAGYINGTGACNGDSGNGLLTITNGRYVLQGVVSISPRRGTSGFCHPRNYSLYTKVMMYVEWILKVLAFENSKTLEQRRKM